MPDYKDHIVSFRVTSAQYAVLTAAAESAGMKVSDYCREITLRDSLGWKKYQFDPKVPLTTFSGTAVFLAESAETKHALYGPDE
jgi:hypothetical protein